MPSRAADAPFVAAPETSPGAEDMAAFAALLSAAARPVLILGGSRWDAQARAETQAFAERFELPVVTSHRRGGLFDAGHPAYAGELGLSPNPKLLERLRASDLLILLGGRLGEVPSQGYTLLDVPTPQIPLVHVYPDAEELGRVYRPALAIHASPRPFAQALGALAPPSPSRSSAARQAARADYLAWSQTATPQPGGVNLGAVMVMLRSLLPDDAVLTNGAGNFAAFINRFHRVRGLDAHIAPTSGSMGYAVPAAVAMKRLYPGRTVVAVSGDGDFLMTGQEFATAVQYRLAIIVIVADNGSYGTIRMHQERAFPGRVASTDLVNPDFAAYARAFGGFGVRVERTEAFGEAFAAAAASGRPAIIHLLVDPDAISPGATLGAIRAGALARLAAAEPPGP
jgi:acetolactate synthase-1/2/3 large subunit